MTHPSTTAAPWTIGRLLAWTKEYLVQSGVDEPRLAAELLLAHALGCRKIELYTRFEAVPGDEQLARYRELVKSAAQHTPIAYLVGQREFYSMTFDVTPDVLIPRPETETLVERVIEHARSRGPEKTLTLLDLGTGSGCIVLAVLKQLPSAIAVATDVSEAALAIARQNAKRHGLAERVTFVMADRLSLPAGAVPDGGFDVLVSNPPYVADRDFVTLAPAVRNHEPRTALVAGPDGLAFYRSIAQQARPLLAEAGAVFVEIGVGQSDAVASIFGEAGRFDSIGAWRDSVSGHVRVLGFQVQSRQDGS